MDTLDEVMVCVVDFKREIGLWHSILAVSLFLDFVLTAVVVDVVFQSVFNGMQVIFIPYALMKINPASWMLMITKYKGIRWKELCQGVGPKYFYLMVQLEWPLSNLGIFTGDSWPPGITKTSTCPVSDSFWWRTEPIPVRHMFLIQGDQLSGMWKNF